jgi:hypothetical protein
MMQVRSVILLTLVASLSHNLAFGVPAVEQDPLRPSELVFTEFFEGLFRMLPLQQTPGVVPDGKLVNGPIAVDENGMVVFFDDLGRLSRFDPTTSIVSPISDPIAGLSFVKFTLESPSSSLVLSGDNLLRIDMNTGAITELLNGDSLNGGFFGAQDVTVTADGRIFVAEFFESLWEVNPVTGAARIISLAEDLFPQALASFSNGDLLIRDFGPARLVRVNPDTRSVSLFSDDLPSFVRDFAVLANDDVVLTGGGQFGGIYRYDGVTGQRRTLYEATGFFVPGWIAVAPGPVPVPEPSTLLLAVSLLAICAGRLR